MDLDTKQIIAEKVRSMRMKVGLMTIFLLSITLTACQTEYEGEYVQWGENGNTDIERLENNHIPYKIEANKVFIPEDALSDAAACCS